MSIECLDLNAKSRADDDQAASRAPLSQPLPLRRVAIFDQTRGLLLFWMICGHAFQLSNLSYQHPLRYVRPGTVTASFVMLTGFLVGWLYIDRPQVTRRDYRKLLGRGLQIGLVAYFSNVFFAFARDLVAGEWSADGVLRMALFQRTWTISAILLIPAMFLAISPLLIQLARRTPPAALLLVMTGVYAAVFVAARQEQPWAEILYGHSRLFQFAIWRLLLLSIWAFGFAGFLKAYRHTRLPWLCCVGAVAVSAGLAAMFAELREPLYRFGWVFPAFAITFFVAAVASRVSQRVGNLLAMIGQSGLLVFLLHRMMLQAMDLAMPARVPAAVASLTLIILTTAGCALACRLKESSSLAKSLLARAGM